MRIGGLVLIALLLGSSAADAQSISGCFCLMNVDDGRFNIECRDVSPSTASTVLAFCKNVRTGEEIEEILIDDPWIVVADGKGSCAPCEYVPIAPDPEIVRSAVQEAIAHCPPVPDVSPQCIGNGDERK